MIPYGNAKRTKVGDTWKFTCQHGVSECQGNMIATCAIKNFDFYPQALPFIICLEGVTSSWATQG